MIISVDNLVQCPKVKKRVKLDVCFECEYFEEAYRREVFGTIISHIQCDYED